MNIPQLRFPEFEGEWEKKKLGEVANKINSGKTPLGGESVYTSEGVFFIRSQNVNNNQLELENITFIPEEINKGMKNSVVKPNDILLNITGASLGRSCVVPSDFKIGNVNQHVCIIRLNQEAYPRFVQPILSSEKGQNIFISLQTGSGREGLNFESIKSIDIHFPSIKEQQKIASFLTAVDAKLHSLKKKKTLLEQYKKGVMQKIFSQELRFKDENGNAFPDWEEKKLGDVLKIPEKIKPNFIDKEKLLTVKLHLKGVIKNESTDGLSIGSTNYYIRKKGQLIYGKQNLFNGALGIIPDEFDNFLSSGDVPSLDIDTKIIDSLFLFNYLGRYSFYKKLEEIASGSGSKRVHEETLLHVNIDIPCLEEQFKISSFLTSIEEKINQISNQIEQFEDWKKGLLQKMFC